MAARGSTKIQHFSFGGGLDLVTPAISIKTGVAIAMTNYEPWYNGGYRRIPGFERFDGRPKPSDATFQGMEVDTVDGLSLGQTVTGSDSGFSGEICGIWDDDGTYGSDSIGITKATGTFTIDDTFALSTVSVTSTPGALISPSLDIEDIWLLEARDNYRADITVPPGAGVVRGAWQLLDKVYCVRDNIGQTAGVIHVASASGWTTTGVNMTFIVPFNGGLAAGSAVVEGDTLTNSTIGETAVIHKIVLNEGSVAWDGSGEGYFICHTVSGGTWADSDVLESPGTTKIADASAAGYTLTLSAGGHYKFHNHNFFALADSYSAYACSGVDDFAIEIDQSGYVSPIMMPGVAPTAGDVLPVGNPFLIQEHRNHLFLAYPGGRVVHSTVGLPFNFSGFLGSAEFGLGDEITGMNSVVGNVLVLTTDRETRGLFGKSVSDWEMKLVGEQTGGKLHSTQKIDTIYALDDLGITSVARTDAFGDFVGATVSQLIQPIVTQLRGQFTDSTIVRETNQYRQYFSENSAIILYVPAGGRQDYNRKKAPEFGFLEYPYPVLKIYNTDDETGKERTYFVSDALGGTDGDDGFVYEDQIGKDFDGAVITSFVRLPFNHVGSPLRRKRFRRADLELNSPQQQDLKFIVDLDYSGDEFISGTHDVSVFGSGGFWDSDNWDEFTWDGASIARARANITGTATNIGFMIFNETAYSDPFILQGMILHYDPRRLQR